MRIVLDSNVLLVAISKRSAYYSIWQAFLNQQLQLIVSNEILFEYAEILQQHSAPLADEIVLEILTTAPNVSHVHVFYNWHAISMDAEDNKFFDAAIAGVADYLVTNDAHFNEVKRLQFPKVEIISAAGFIKLINPAG